MSTLKIEERITVSAPPGRVWEFLLDPVRVAGCLPGAKLDGVEGERTFLGTMKVKVGPVLMEFKGKATMSEVAPAERRVTLTGTGNDKSGGGSAKMDMKSHIVALDGGGSEIVVVADVDLAGKLVRFGRGMMEGISKQLFKQFAERVRAELASAEEGAAEEKAEAETPPVAAEATAGKETPEASASEGAAQPETAAAEPATEAPKSEEPAPAAATDASGGAPPEGGARPAEDAPPAETRQEPAAKSPAAAPASTKKMAELAPKENEPLDAGSLVWAAIWAWIKGLLRGVFRRRR